MHLFDAETQRIALREAFYPQALIIARTLEHHNVNEHEIILIASHYTEQALQTARRHADELKRMSESVLIDERNHQLATYVNQQAQAMGLQQDATPFSGVETQKGSPSRAYGCKLSADSSLNRGAARGLMQESITALVSMIQQQATQDIRHYVSLRQQEMKEAHA